jgi:outer membrane autotransporter protein
MPFVEGGNTFVPRVSAEYLYDFIGDEAESTGKFATGNSFTVKGADVAQSTLRLGAGLTLLTQDNIELSVDYSGDIKADYDSHAGAVKVRVNF